MKCDCFTKIDAINEKNGLDFKGIEMFYCLKKNKNGSLSPGSFLGAHLVKRGTNRKTNSNCIFTYCPFCGKSQSSEDDNELDS
jgi:hypothetical protein